MSQRASESCSVYCAADLRGARPTEQITHLEQRPSMRRHTQAPPPPRSHAERGAIEQDRHSHIGTDARCAPACTHTITADRFEVDRNG
ncbi:hypothetical protein GY45DRAFT_1145461 [Cubamyces sp. BRFM 1775]|nr:hypothetical protein GY45DRAFT_1145461 [Cubamyces sp. BRFM 1775]